MPVLVPHCDRLVVAHWHGYLEQMSGTLRQCQLKGMQGVVADSPPIFCPQGTAQHAERSDHTGSAVNISLLLAKCTAVGQPVRT